MTRAEQHGAGRVRIYKTAQRFLAPLLIIVAPVLAPVPGWAASQRQLDLDEMVALADDIVVGRVVGSEARWQGKLIVTVSTVEVSDSLKGRPQAEIEITQLGGTAVHPVIGAPVTGEASHQVALRAGEHVLLFVSRTKNGARQLVGGSQGKYVVREEPVTGTPNLPVGPKKLRVVREGDRHVVSAEEITLDAMRERIRSSLHRQQEGKGAKPK